MEIILAKTAGFCFGVNRAMDMCSSLTDAYTYGPLIHNNQVVEALNEKGVRAIDPKDASSLKKGSTIVIRSHGISQAEEDKLKSAGLNIIDATCPFVKKIHNIVKAASEEGKTVIIVGDKDHPEVIGIKGHCGENSYVVGDFDDIDKLPQLNSVKIVSQTTYNEEKFKKMIEKILHKCYDFSITNTICNATHERQEEALSIASKVDAMIIVGGRSSSNSQKLFQICKSACEKVVFVETAQELSRINFENVKSIGITAGASTPCNIIQEVLTYARTEL